MENQGQQNSYKQEYFPEKLQNVQGSLPIELMMYQRRFQEMMMQQLINKPEQQTLSQSPSLNNLNYSILSTQSGNHNQQQQLYNNNIIPDFKNNFIQSMSKFYQNQTSVRDIQQYNQQPHQTYQQQLQLQCNQYNQKSNSYIPQQPNINNQQYLSNLEEMFTQNMNSLNQFYCNIEATNNKQYSNTHHIKQIHESFNLDNNNNNNLYSLDDNDISLPTKSEYIINYDKPLQSTTHSHISQSDVYSPEDKQQTHNTFTHKQQNNQNQTKDNYNSQTQHFPNNNNNNNSNNKNNSIQRLQEQQDKHEVDQRRNQNLVINVNQGDNENIQRTYDEEYVLQAGQQGVSSFDEIPIKSGGNKTFDEILNENLKIHNENQNENSQRAAITKEFLKKNTHKYLSSSISRSQSKQTVSKDTPPLSTKNENSFNNSTQQFASSSSLETKIQKTIQHSNEESIQNENLSPKILPKKRFLSRGQGIGGGKGLNCSREQSKTNLNSTLTKHEKKQQIDIHISNDNTLMQTLNENSPGYIILGDFKIQETYHSENSIEKNQQEIVIQSNSKSKLMDTGEQQQNVSKGELQQEEEESKGELKDKMEELNTEMEKLKLENQRVKKLRQKHEDMLRKLNQEIEEFNMRREKELQEIEELKQEEIRKIRKERKIAERQSKAVAALPNRKEKEEIDNLKQLLIKIQEESKLKDSRNKSQIDRLKKQIDELTSRNNELTNQIQNLLLTQSNNIFNTQLQSPNDIHNQNIYSQNQHKLREQQHVLSKISAQVKNYSQNKKNNLTHNHFEYSQELQTNNNSDNEDDLNQNQQQQITNNKNSTAGAKEQQFNNNNNTTATDSPTNNTLQTKKTEEYKYYFNEYFKRYNKHKDIPAKIISQNVSADGKIQRVYSDGKKEVVFHNGVKREIFPDGYIIAHFTNGDIKQTLPDNTVIYYFTEAQTTQTSIVNGPQIYIFANEQLEFHYTDGSKHIRFPDGTEKNIQVNGEEETIFVDGTVQRINKSKVKIIEYTDKKKDTVYTDGTRIRQYPDGRIKKITVQSKE